MNFLNIKKLTTREMEVFELLAKGATNKRVADKLGIGARTVEVHRERVCKKLCIAGGAQLVYVAIQTELVSLGSFELRCILELARTEFAPRRAVRGSEWAGGQNEF